MDYELLKISLLMQYLLHSYSWVNILIYLVCIFSHYLQIRHFTVNRYSTFPNLPEKTILDSSLDINVHKKGVIKEMYLYIYLFIYYWIYSLHLSIIKSHWEIDLARNISADLWDCMLHTVGYTGPLSALLKFKVLHRLHISKEKFAKLYPDSDPMCNRCKAEIRSLIHTFWKCPTLNNYWTAIYKTLSETYKIKLAPSALIALFGVIPPGISIVKHYSNAVAFASLLGRRLILVNWKKETPPTHDQWITDLMRFLYMEKMRSTLTGSLTKFNKSWQPFLKYMETFKMCTRP